MLAPARDSSLRSGWRGTALVCAAALGLAAASVAAATPPESLQLVESAPVETTLDHPDIPNAAQVWLEMIRGAKSSLEFGEFYASNQENSALDPIVQAVEAAADRGVKIRFIADAGFSKKEPSTLERLSKHRGIDVRRYDWSGKVGGGIHHAKYFIVDRREVYLGSQNFDWRSLDHIQELGVRTRVPAVVEALGEVFDTDWAISGGGTRPTIPAHPNRFPVEARFGESTVRVWFVGTPKGWLPDEGEWSLPRLVSMIDSARKTVRVQVLTYLAIDREGYFDVLESAIRRAAARKVQVQLLVADWSKRPGVVEGLKSLQSVPNVAVKFMSIPASSKGFIPYARVVHAKYMVVDGEHSWIGTSNWERNYFEKSRNVGLVIDGASMGDRLDRFFLQNWESPYATSVDPCAQYEPPKVSP